MTKVKSIYLHGSLSKYREEPIRLAAHTPLQIWATLDSRYDTLLSDCKQMSIAMIGYTKGANAVPLTIDDMNSDLGDIDSIHIVPEHEGAGIETALIAAGYTAFAAAVITVAINIAISIVVGMVVAMLTPKPKTQGPGKDSPSYISRGPEMFVQPGNKLPKIYGRGKVNTTLIHTGAGSKNIPLAS